MYCLDPAAALEKVAERMGRCCLKGASAGRRIESILSATMEALARYSWPGNIRELQNVIEQAVILSPGTSLLVPRGNSQPAATPAPVRTTAAISLADAEREHILVALRETGCVVGGPKGAAARLGMKRSVSCWKMFSTPVAPVRWHTRQPAGAPRLTLLFRQPGCLVRSDPQVLPGKYFASRGKDFRLAGIASAMRESG